jgi:V/A-type H+-transporting ATPase subunit A
MVYLQQDAFDEVDVSVSLERQKENFKHIIELVNIEYQFVDQEQARTFFIKLTGLFKNLNYAKFESVIYKELTDKIERLVNSIYK